MGPFLLAQFVPGAASLPRGTVLVINTESGEYVAAQSERAALDLFAERFGWGVPGYVYMVD